jgi:hypothetical protein
MTGDKRLQGRIDKQREEESRWLQKVLFSLSKAREAREKLIELSGEELNPLITLDDGSQIELDKLESIIEGRVEELMDVLGHGVYGRRKG